MGDRFSRLFETLAPDLYAPVQSGVQSSLNAGLKSLSLGQPSEAEVVFYRNAAQENINLIKSIPQEHLDKIRLAINEAATQGQLVGYSDIAARLNELDGITPRRAHLIAMDQTRKVYQGAAETRVISAVQESPGLTQVRGNQNYIPAIWIHSHSGGGDKRPRKKHLEMNGKEYNLLTGAPVGDNGQFVKPGEEVNCRCTFRLVLNSSEQNDADE